ncbi:flagellar hook protein FlgE [Lichenibacterium dinghuense]|uniref:flagellar hook protein FlgE n=1 Tax=Lichenibacterium dinghuense TaxID=2895977 RepID=UPI001F3DEE98|nr:flagellar hook protein FlgE [Lichenibacterium sp. 6Y81]
MSLFGTLNTGVSGMAAQANMLSTIGDNIANSATTGYKSATVDFETMLGNQTTSDYTSGGVQSKVRYGIGDQGTLTASTSVTDLAIKGNGFFVVQGSNGATALTRAGSFVADASGDLVNTAGYKLMGYNLTDGSTATANGTGGLQVINLNKQQLNAAPSQTGTLQFNLPSNAASGATSKTSIVAYDDLGNPLTLDITFTKTGANAWSAQITNDADGTTIGAAQPLTYDPTTGKLASGSNASATTLTADLTSLGGKKLTLDVSQSTQLASSFTINTATVDGSAPSKLDHVTIGTDGTVTSVYANGVSEATYRIPLADVPSPDSLTSLTGNVYQANLASGNMTIGTATTGSLGEIDSGNLENSTVDLATELTSMISAQRSYEANSKVIQASSDLLKVVDQLSS